MFKKSLYVFLFLYLVSTVAVSVAAQDVTPTGDLQITANPGLRVYLDEEDNFVGKTNKEDDGLYLEGLPAGPHIMIIKKSGFLPGRFSIEIKPESAVELIVEELKPDVTIRQTGEETGAEVEASVGSLRIRSVPLKCEIEFLGRTTSKEKDVVTIEGIPVGPYSIEFRRQGKTLKHRVTIVANTQLELLAHFRKGEVLEIAPKDMVLIPAGEFLMGSTEEEIEWAVENFGGEIGWYQNELPQHTVYLDPYYIDKYEVTNAQFCEFLNETGNREKGRGIPIAYENGRYQPTSGYKDRPVINVSWYEAKAYAKWAGKRLPTEAEWEKAARGGLAGKKYPWGDSIDSGKANYDRNVGDTTPVGSYPPNDYGLYDMAGNVFEWVSDWYDDDYYSSSSSHRNPQGPNNAFYRVLRGGSWDDVFAGFLRCATRNSAHPDRTGKEGGFRCVKSL